MNERALVEMTFPGIACWVALARRWATDALMAAGHQDLDSVRLVTSELVGNAVVHTRSGRPGGLVTVKVVEVGDALARIEVIDEGAATVACPRRSGDDECGGRGLWIVQRSSTRWGTWTTPLRSNLVGAEVTTRETPGACGAAQGSEGSIAP